MTPDICKVASRCHAKIVVAVELDALQSYSLVKPPYETLMMPPANSDGRMTARLQEWAKSFGASVLRYAA